MGTYDYSLPSGLNAVLEDYAAMRTELKYKTSDLADMRHNYTTVCNTVDRYEQTIQDLNAKLQASREFTYFGGDLAFGFKLAESLITAHPAILASVKGHYDNNKKIQGVKEIREFFRWYIYGDTSYRNDQVRIECGLKFAKEFFEFLEAKWNNVAKYDIGDPWEVGNEEPLAPWEQALTDEPPF
jgi:hypothetical protein